MVADANAAFSEFVCGSWAGQTLSRAVITGVINATRWRASLTVSLAAIVLFALR